MFSSIIWSLNLGVHLRGNIWNVTSKCKLYFLLNIEVFVLLFVLLSSICCTFVSYIPSIYHKKNYRFNYLLYILYLSYFFFLCPTICCTFCSSSKLLSYFFSKSNYLLYFLFKSQVFIILFLKSKFYVMSYLGFRIKQTHLPLIRYHYS